jgi:hypothetical protein
MNNLQLHILFDLYNDFFITDNRNQQNDFSTQAYLKWVWKPALGIDLIELSSINKLSLGFLSDL